MRHNRFRRGRVCARESIAAAGTSFTTVRARLLSPFLVMAVFTAQVNSFGQQVAPQPQKGGNPIPLTCDAEPKIIKRGDAVKIKINSEGNGLIYAFGSSNGTLIVKDNLATLNTADVPDGISEITVVCSAVGSDGQIVHTLSNDGGFCLNDHTAQ